MTGPCYPTSEALYHSLGGKAFGLTPMQIKHEGVSHWYLRWDLGGHYTYYIDPTSTQFKTPVPYAEGKGRGFLTKKPSKRAQAILQNTIPLDDTSFKIAIKEGLNVG